MLTTAVKGTADFLITATGGYQCEAEPCLHSFVRFFVGSLPSLCEAQDAPGVELGIGDTELRRGIHKSDKAQPCGAQSLVVGGDKATSRLTCYESGKVPGSGARVRAGITLSLLICKMGMVVPLKGLNDKCTAECPMSIVALTIAVQGQREEGQGRFEGGGEVCLEI